MVVLAVRDEQLDLMTLKIFFNLNDSMILFPSYSHLKLPVGGLERRKGRRVKGWGTMGINCSKGNFDRTVKKKKISPEIRIALGQVTDWWVQYNHGDFQNQDIALKISRDLTQHKLCRDSLEIQQVEFLNNWHARIIIALRVYGFPECSEVQLGIFHTARVPSEALLLCT